MGLSLNEYQRQVANAIRDMTLAAKCEFHQGLDVRAVLRIAAAYAHALHIDLERGGQKISHSKTMMQNRNCSAETEEFYNHLHSLEDFISIVG
jgi:hypothetical protein